MPPLPPGTPLLLGPEGVRPLGRATRSFGATESGLLSEFQAPLNRLRRGLRSRASFLAGVAFPHVDAPSVPAADDPPEDTSSRARELVEPGETAT